MKFYSSDPVFFSDVAQDLHNENDSISVVHFRYWEEAEIKKKNHLIVVEDCLEPKELVSQVYTKGISHFVQKEGENFSADLKRAGNLIECPKEYFQSQYLMIEPKDVISKQFFFSGPEDKAQLMEEVEKFLSQLRNLPAVEGAIAAIEELYMNAVIDAPKESKRLGYKITSTQCELFLAYNKDTLQISCSDPYGSLELKKLFGRLYEVYQKGAGEAIDFQGPGGAGIGCYLLFEKCRALFFGVRLAVQTRVTCLIPRAATRRAHSGFKKSLHGFEVE